MRKFTNLSYEEAIENGWNILKPLNCEVVGKAVFDDEGLKIMKSTKRFKVEGGWIYNTSTEIHGNEAGVTTIAVAEALVFVPEK